MLLRVHLFFFFFLNNYNYFYFVLSKVVNTIERKNTAWYSEQDIQEVCTNYVVNTFKIVCAVITKLAGLITNDQHHLFRDLHVIRTAR